MKPLHRDGTILAVSMHVMTIKPVLWKHSKRLLNLMHVTSKHVENWLTSQRKKMTLGPSCHKESRFLNIKTTPTFGVKSYKPYFSAERLKLTFLNTSLAFLQQCLRRLNLRSTLWIYSVQALLLIEHGHLLSKEKTLRQ